MPEWKKVIFAADCVLCPCCEEELMRPQCETHYSDCECPGPTQEDEYEYREVGGVLEARLLT